MKKAIPGFVALGGLVAVGVLATRRGRKMYEQCRQMAEHCSQMTAQHEDRREPAEQSEPTVAV